MHFDFIFLAPKAFGMKNLYIVKLFANFSSCIALKIFCQNTQLIFRLNKKSLNGFCGTNYLRSNLWRYFLFNPGPGENKISALKIYSNPKNR